MFGNKLPISGFGVEAHFRLEALVLEVLFVRVEPFVGYLPKNHLRFGVSIFRFRVSGFDFQVWGLGFRVSGFGFRFRVQCLRARGG